MINTIMNTVNLRKLINLFEDRKANIEYTDVDTDKVIANLRSYDSQTYTKLAQKIERIEELEAEITQLKNEVKADTKEKIYELFDVADITKTRVVDTLSFIFTMSKDPKVTKSPRYKEILEQLEAHLTPELIEVLNMLKLTLVTEIQKSPSLKVKKKTIDE